MNHQVKVKVKKTDLDNYIREFLKEHDVTSIDMIKNLAKALAYYLNKYEIDIIKDFEDFKDTSNDDCISVAASILILNFIQNKVLEQKEDL